jgi:hypothetical protein
MPRFKDLPEKKPAWESDVSSEQDQCLASTGKYKKYRRDEKADGSEVHEYVSPDGPGYVVFEYITKGEDTYVRATGKGPETYRYFDWRLVEKE